VADGAVRQPFCTDLPRLMDDREVAVLAKALGNPLRIRFVHTLHGRGPKGTLTRREFSEETGVGLHNLEIHVDALRGGGVLEIAEMVRRRGAMEHRYSLSGPRGAGAVAAVDLLQEGLEGSIDHEEGADVLRALGHPVRVAYLRALVRRGRTATLSRGDFMRESGVEPFTASYHGAALRDAGVIEVAEVVRQRGAPELRYGIGGPRAKMTVAVLRALAAA
jgi:DNA-binding transcriptional ArsR family regulator